MHISKTLAERPSGKPAQFARTIECVKTTSIEKKSTEILGKNKAHFETRISKANKNKVWLYHQKLRYIQIFMHK